MQGFLLNIFICHNKNATAAAKAITNKQNNLFNINNNHNAKAIENNAAICKSIKSRLTFCESVVD
jgi:hypothetical protein